MRFLSLSLFLTLGLAAQTCPIPDFPSGGVPEGKIEASDCTVREYASFSNSSARADAWKLTVSADAVYTLRMTSSDMPVTLYLIRERTPIDVVDGEAGSKGAEILVRLRPGSYTIIAAAGLESSTGAYRLTSASEKPRPCLPQDIKPDDEVSGVLDAADCRLADLVPFLPDPSPIDIYRFQLEERKVLKITQESSEMDSYLELTRSDGRFLAGNDDYGQSLNSRIMISLEPGAYLIYASTIDGGTGAYRLRTQSDAVRSCPVSPVEPDSEINVPLSAEDCRWLDLFPFTTSEAPVKRVRMNVKRESVASLDVASARVSPVVYLMDDRGRSLGSSRSRLVASVVPGDWTVLATRSGSAYGDVRLKWTQENLRECPPGELGVPSERTSALTTGECRVLDAVPPSSNAAPARVFRFSPGAEQVVTIQASAEKWKPSLSLIVGRSAIPGSAEGLFTSLFTPGEYRLLASHSRETGDFQIRTSSRDPRPCPAEPLVPGETKDGSITKDSCGITELIPLMSLSTGVKASVYSLTIDQSGPVTLQVTSSAFPPAIMIPFDREWETGVLEFNSSLAQTASVRWTARPGTYKVLVFSLLPLTGNFRISVSPVEGSSPVAQ